MLLHDPGATPFDLRFRLFGTDVRVSPWFWIGSAFLGWNGSQLARTGNPLGDLVVWIACVFFSILLHEFGHIWMGRVFGGNGYILLQAFGGLAVGSADVSSHWKRILISAAGPAIQLVFYGMLIGMIRVGAFSFLEDGDDLSRRIGSLTLSRLLLINLAWPILNLLPIWPLDGGQITRDSMQIVAPRQGLIVSLWISLLVAGGLTLHAILWEVQTRSMIKIANSVSQSVPWLGSAMFRFGGWYLAILFGLLAIGSFQAIQAENASRKRYWEDDDRPPWER